MRVINLGLRFLLEILLLVALAYWGFETHDGAIRWVLGLGAPIAAALTWGAFVAPKSSRRLADPLRLIVEIVLYGLGVLSLIDASQPTSALVFGALVVINLILLTVWNQR